MVFESVVVDVLNRYLKPYVKKLDTSQLKVGVWKGHASLDKLELKEDLFAEADLDVPLKIKRSFIGKLEMQIPWKRLTKDPLVITIDEVYVIVGPNIDTTYDPEAALVHDRKEKEKKIEKFLEALKSKKKLEKENKKGKKKDSEKPDSFAEKLAVHLTKNLQVLVRDIHVRYEDSVTKPGTTLAAGATLHSLEVKSTDENWVPSVVRETATVIYKLLELNSLGIYWNSHAQSMTSLDMPTMIEEMRNSIARPACAPPPSNAYILSPMTGTAKLKMNVKIGGDLSMPQLVGGINVGDIVFSLHHDQLKAVLQTTEFFSRHNVNKKYLKYRPSVPLGKDKGAWWRYAITAVLEEDVKRRTRMWSWKHLKKHRELCVRYQKKYHEKLHSVSVSSSLKEELQRLEDQMDWFNIMIYRKAAAKKLKKHAKGASVTSSLRSSDVSRGPDERRPVFSSGSKEAKREEKARKEEEKARAVAKKEEEKARAVAKKEEEKARLAAKKEEEKAAKKKEKKSSNKDFFSKLKTKIKSSSKKKEEPGASGGVAAVAEASSASFDEKNWDVVNETEESLADVSGLLEGGDEAEEKAREQLYKDIGYTDNEEWKYPKEYVGHEVHVNVNSLTLELLGQKCKIGHLLTKKIGVNLYHRPATKAISISTSVHSMVMSGIPLEGQPTTLVTSLVGGAQDIAADLVNLQLEVRPIERPEMDITVKAALRPIQITYDFATVNSLIEMFKPPNMIHFQELTQAASASWEELKSQTSASLKQAVRDRKQVELDITLQSPFMVVPEKGQMKKDSHLIVADLGKLRVFGQTTDNKSATIKSGVNALDKFYDTFTIKLDGMQVLVAKPDEDWRSAMATPNSSPLHILDPTGFEIVLLKSIVDRDALLPSLRVEGTLPGFEVKISDTKLASLVKVASSMEKPPALITVTDQYDALPPLPIERLALDSVTEIADLETVSLSTVDYGSGEESGSEDSLSLTRTPSTKEKGGSKEEDATAKHVFTDVSIKLNIQKVALKLTKTEHVKKVEHQTALLDVVIREIKADVVDRKWDSQGSVSLQAMEVLDYVTLDANKKPTYLLKTQALNDGNFMSARFVTITRLGADFAAKYTGLQDTVSAQLSLVKINLNSSTVASLLQYTTTILPIIKKPEAASPDSKSPSLTDEQVEQAVDRAITSGGVDTLDGIEALNPNDVTVPKKALDLHFDVKFEGINISLLESSAEILHTGVTGFAVKGRAQTEKVSVDVKINDLSVVDTSVTNAQTAQVIRKAQQKKDIVALSLVQYNLASHKRDPNRMDWVDTSIEAEMGRIIVNVDTNFVKNIMEFVQHLHIKQELFQSAAVATAETANATAQAIAETAKTAHRVKMAVKFHAPSVLVPYSTENQEGAIHLNLGDFSLSNNFMHAHEMEGKVADTISLLSAKTVLDCIEIRTSSIEMFRSSHSTVCDVGGAGGGDTTKEKRNTILEPMAFVARINRNISQPSEAYPNVDIILQLDTIKFHLHEDDVQAFLSIGEVGMRLATSYIPSPPSPEEAMKIRSQTLAMGKPAKRRSGILSGFNTTRPRATTAASKWQQAARLKRFHTLSGKEVKDVRVTASLKSLTLDFATIHAPLFNFTVSDLNTSIDVYKSKVDVSASVDSLSLVDLSAEGMHSKVVSLAEHTNKVSSLDLSVSLDKNLGPMAPMGTISTNLAQIRLVVVTPFVMKTVKFVKRLKFDFDPSVLKNASKVAQDGASAVSTMAHDKYFKVEVTVHAPVIIFPVSESSDQGFMLDLGSLAIQNTLLVPDQSQVRVGIDAYGIKLDSFKVSRVLLDSSVKTGSPVVAERVLLQPFHMLLALERNLCGWYTQIPSLSVNLTMGELGILLGQEDLEQFFKVGMSVAEEVLSILPKTEAPPPPKVSDTPSDTLPTVKEEESEEKPFKKFIVMSSLPLFELKLYKNEPHLSLKDKTSQSLSDCQKCALASFQLVTMELKVHVSSASEVEVQASLKDIALCNLQEETEKRNTGNRVIQHYTSNPLKAFTGKIEKPLINISYILTLDKEHNIIVSAHDLLILSDVEFMSMLAEYFRAIVDQEAIARLKEIQQQQEDPEPAKGSETPAIEPSSALEKKSLKEKEVKASEAANKTVLPKLKCQLSISNFRVAIIEDVYTQQPQALSLNLSSVHGHVQLSEQHKHASLSISELGIATSSFFDLDNTTSWILLPSNMMMTLSGPADRPAMDITISVEPISLTLSPAVVRLIIHAIQTLVPKKEVKVEEPPRNLWMKQVIGNKFWFLKSSGGSDQQKALPSTSAVPSERKGEVLTLNVESVEIMLEDEGTAKSAALPVLALNSTAVIQMYEWTGQLEISGEVHVEATYYNRSFSLWEPILETLERKDGKQILWDVEIKASKAPPQEAVEGDLSRKPNFSLELISNSPLQLTLTKTSMQLIKSLVDSYKKEYGKQVEGSVEVKALTGAPYTVVNKLGSNTSLFVQPGKSLKLMTKAEFSKLSNEESVDLKFVKVTSRRSHASLIGRQKSEADTVDIIVGQSFRTLKSVAIDTPGLHYYTLVPKEEYDASMSTYGVVVDVAVTGTKKTIIVRSPIQFKNHLEHDIDILSLAPTKSSKEEFLNVLKAGKTYNVPIDVAQTHSFSVRPTGFGYTPVGNHITWQKRKDGQHMELKCVMAEDNSVSFFSQVVFREEKFRMKRKIMDEDYPHHVFHIHPPIILQNLLPFKISMEALDQGFPMSYLTPGQSMHVHQLDLGKSPELRLSVIQGTSVSLKGKFHLEKKQPEYATFPTTSNGATPTQLTLHSEDFGYLKVGVYCAFWMINKTGLSLEYKEGNKQTKHPCEKHTVLLSTNSPKSKIQFRAVTEKQSTTEWTKSFAVNAVGTSGNFSAKLGENVYRFGVEIYLSQFTLTKMVMITPYYLLANKTKNILKVHEQYNQSVTTTIPPGDVVPFWTLNNSDKMVLMVGETGGKKRPASSKPFNFKKSDNTVLQFGEDSEVVSVCLEVQETESATLVTFSPYYEGSVPLLVINHFPDVSLRFAQNIKGSVIIHSLSARESQYYVWDDPLGKKLINWNFPSASQISKRKPINVTKDCEGHFSMTFEGGTQSAASVGPQLSLRQASDNWIEVEESILPAMEEEDPEEMSVTGSQISDQSSDPSLSSLTTTSASGVYRGYWKSFIDGLQRVLIFTPDENVLTRIKAMNSFSVPLFSASLSLKVIGLSLVDNNRKRELAYISVSPSGVIWQLDKGKKKRIWKTLSHSVISILEEAYQEKKKDIKIKNLVVNLETMEMFTPLKGKLRRTHYDGVQFKFTMTEQDFAIQAKIGHVQVDNQLPFSVYPQVLYPLPPPPTIASTTEPKPFVEASIILKKPDKSNVAHFKYVHVLVQKISLNVDLGFILSLADFFTLSDRDPLLELEYVKNDIEYAENSLMKTVVPELAEDIGITRMFFDVLHLSPIKINLSFNVRSVGKNKGSNEISVGDRFLHLFLDSIGVILTSVQDIEMKFSLFHLEYQPQTTNGMKDLMIKHYRNQALTELHTLIFGLDVLGNPVSVVRGVVIGAKDLFYEPFKGSVLGPEEFFEGLGIGLRSFFGAGVVGGLTGAGAKITGAFGDVFAKLTFDDEFIEQRQQTKAKPPKMGWKLGGFAKNVLEGVTGVVTQPVKGLQKEGAVGLLKGTGKGLVGLLVRPTGGLVDLASGTLDFVTRKTKIGNFEISDVRPPRFIGRDGVIRPYSADKAVGTALLVSVDEGGYVETDYYVGHIQVQPKPMHFILVTDRRLMLIERKMLTEGWTSFQDVQFETFESPVDVKDHTIVINYSKKYKDRKFRTLSFKAEDMTQRVGQLINHSYVNYFLKEQ